MLQTRSKSAFLWPKILRILLNVLFILTIPSSVFSVNAAKGSLFDNDPEQIRIIDQAIAAFMHEHAIPGIAVVVFDGKNERFLNYGVADLESRAPVTENTIFEIASVTKVFTTTALAMHILNGDMALNDPIAKYIPALADPSLPISKVTLLELATHSSSLPRTGGDWHHGGLPKIIRFLQHWKPSDPIGSQYGYSNIAMGLLGYALEKVENRPYDDLIKGDILLPLGMNMTFTQVPESLFPYYATGYTLSGKKAKRRPHGYIPGSGAIRSTTRDLLKFLKANMAVSGPSKLVKAMQFAQQPFYKVREHFVMGLAWQRVDIKGKLYIDKNGGLQGFTSYIGWIPEKHLGVVILTNKTKARTTEVGRFLLTHLK